MAQRIERVEAWLLQLPLARPYKLAFGLVSCFDTLLVRVQLAGGEEGWGEATLLTGYTDETVEDTWRMAQGLVSASRAHLDALEVELDRLDATHPFLTTAFRTAIEMAARSPLLALENARRVPILGLLQADDPARMGDEVDALLAAGYRTFKLKVGFDPQRDAAFVGAAQRVVAGRARLRIDANQGYDVGQARDFVARLAPDDIELFEQPCAAGDWDAHMAVLPLARERGIPLMLDESIYTLAEVERAAEFGAARFIKVKLMKFNTLARLDAAIARIRALGMTPVLGNGVANELGCWMEACVAARRIDNAGEMNGFLKPRTRLFAEPLPFDDGAIQLPAGWRPRIDSERLAAHAKAHVAAP